MTATRADTPVSEWTPLTDWEITPSLAYIAADDNYLAAYPGKLKGSAEGGANAVIITPDSPVTDEIAPTGRLRFFRQDSTVLELDYSAYEISGGSYVFSLELPEEESFSEQTQVDIIQSPLISADTLLRDLSDPENGVFVFDLPISGWRLSRIMEYTNTEVMSVKGMELTVSGIDPETQEECVLLRCQAPLNIKGVLYLHRSPAATPDHQLSAVQEWILGLLSAGIEVEFQDPEGNWGEYQEDSAAFRWRLAGIAGIPWSTEIPLI
jgi:hypothetical protein